MAWFETYEAGHARGARMHASNADGGACMCDEHIAERQRAIDAECRMESKIDGPEDYAVDRSRDERIGL